MVTDVPFTIEKLKIPIAHEYHWKGVKHAVYTLIFEKFSWHIIELKDLSQLIPFILNRQFNFQSLIRMYPTTHSYINNRFIRTFKNKENSLIQLYIVSSRHSKEESCEVTFFVQIF